MKQWILWIFILLSLRASGQGYGNIWIFGNQPNISMDFNSGNAEVYQFNSDYLYFITSATISNANGELQFYSNGRYVINKTGQIMSNGDNLSPVLKDFINVYYGPENGYQTIQGNIILPKPGSDSLYYMFQIEYDSVLLSEGLNRPYYLLNNLIDMSQENGLGKVMEKNIIIFADTMSEAGMSVCRHANGRDWWLVKNEYLTNCYYIWLITPDTVIGPTEQCLGLPVIEPVVNSNFEFSPDGTHFANHERDASNYLVNIFDFDRCSGIFGNSQVVYLPDSAVTTSFFRSGCTFSPNSQFIYAFTSNQVYQIDLLDSDIQSSITEVSSWIYTDSTYIYFLEPSLAPDGKIYINGVVCTGVLSVINNPDQKGNNCTVTLQSFDLPTNNGCGLPHMPNYQLGALPGSPCDTLSTTTTIASSNEIKPLRVIPNPNNGVFAVSYELPKNKVGMLTITNQLGKVVYKEQRPQWSTICNINVSKLPQGVYLVTIESNGKRKNVKFVKQ